MVTPLTQQQNRFDSQKTHRLWSRSSCPPPSMTTWPYTTPYHLPYHLSACRQLCTIRTTQLGQREQHHQNPRILHQTQLHHALATTNTNPPPPPLDNAEFGADPALCYGRSDGVEFGGVQQGYAGAGGWERVEVLGECVRLVDLHQFRAAGALDRVEALLCESVLVFVEGWSRDAHFVLVFDSDWPDTAPSYGTVSAHCLLPPLVSQQSTTRHRIPITTVCHGRGECGGDTRDY